MKESDMERKKASDYPQELLDLFHEYQHGDISRRDFLDRAKKFAVGGVTAMALFETLKPNYAWAQQVKADDPRIKVGYETVQSPEGNGTIKGYFARPASASGKLPGVLVIHENRGLNPYVEDVARRFAVANFIAYAPDGLTSVGGFPGNDEQGAVKFREVNGPKMFEDFVASAKWLKARPDCTGKIAAIGFCFGGGVVNNLAVRLGADLAAGAPFYGAQPSAENTAKIMAPLMLHYADPTKDTGIGQRIPAFEEALKANKKTYQLFIYEGAQHGFHNDTTPRYDEAAAKEAWQHTLDWFNRYLRV
jgi:carboxymethylenebutenolidase